MQLHSHGAAVDAADDTRLRLFLSHQALRPLAHLPPNLHPGWYTVT